MKDLWVVGKIIIQTEHGTVWELQGVFDDEKLAVEACLNPYYFVGPVKLNFPIPDETTEWSGCYYPLLFGPYK